MSLRNPVQYPVKYYSWQDTNAPQLSDVDGVIKTILKACLVTGYGSKAGAGWTATFEDAYRIVLRRPLRTGNPPDIKIENGVINSVASHRIVAQDNPTGLDDAVELSAVNLLARDSKCGKEWHCVVTDFSFILCYQMGNNSTTPYKNNILIVGAIKKLRDNDVENFIVNSASSTLRNGTTSTHFSFLSSGILKEMRTNKDYTTKLYLSLNVTEKYYNNDFFAQKVIIDTFAELPFYLSIPTQVDNIATSIVTIQNRSCLRYVNAVYNSSSERALYIPLDYWEL